MTVTYSSLLKSGDVHKAHKIQVKQNKENKENEHASNKKKHFDDLELNSNMVELRHDEAEAQNEGAGNNKPILSSFNQPFVTPDDDEDYDEVEDDESEECEYESDSDSDYSGFSEEEEEEEQTPFWFGYEESEHLPIIFERYTSFLELAEEARLFPRAPPPFIARIRRIGIEGCDCYANNEDDVFQTYDTICVCYRKTVAPGTPLELARKEYVLTTWDKDGVPICFQSLRDMNKRKTYQDRLLNGESYLFCVPFMGYDDLAVSSDKRPLTFASTATDFASVLLQQQQQEEKAFRNLRGDNDDGEDHVEYNDNDYDWFK